MAPFVLPWSSEVWVKVSVTNLYGTSELSDEGNGAVIYAVPDAPVNVQENYADRTGSTLGIIWEDG
jgi:hypothetical protein